jgi:hypothetical protein
MLSNSTDAVSSSDGELARAATGIWTEAEHVSFMRCGWTEDEHVAFEAAVKRFGGPKTKTGGEQFEVAVAVTSIAELYGGKHLTGQKDWAVRVAEHVGTRTAVQVRTYYQKWCGGFENKRRRRRSRRPDENTRRRSMRSEEADGAEGAEGRAEGVVKRRRQMFKSLTKM